MEWQKNQISDPGFESLYHTFSYPFSNNNTLLNIHLNKELKSHIVDSVQDISGELRAISIGIFSAEIGARQWFHANQLESYAVWKMGKNHIDQLLIVKGGEFQSFVTFKRLKNSVKILNNISSTTITEKITMFLNHPKSCLSGEPCGKRTKTTNEQCPSLQDLRSCTDKGNEGSRIPVWLASDPQRRTLIGPC